MKKILPKFPMVVVLMAAGVLLSYFVPISNWGIRTLDAVEPGLPVWSIPDFSAIGLKEAVIYSLSIAERSWRKLYLVRIASHRKMVTG